MYNNLILTPIFFIFTTRKKREKQYWGFLLPIFRKFETLRRNFVFVLLFLSCLLLLMFSTMYFNPYIMLFPHIAQNIQLKKIKKEV